MAINHSLPALLLSYRSAVVFSSVQGVSSNKSGFDIVIFFFSIFLDYIFGVWDCLASELWLRGIFWL